MKPEVSPAKGDVSSVNFIEGISRSWIIDEGTTEFFSGFVKKRVKKHQNDVNLILDEVQSLYVREEVENSLLSTPRESMLILFQ